MSNEIQEAVGNIAVDIFDSTGGVEYFDLIYSTNGWVDFVEFIGIRLWCSEDDDRPYVDENEEIYIPIEEHLRNRINEELEKLSRIRV